MSKSYKTFPQQNFLDVMANYEVWIIPNVKDRLQSTLNLQSFSENSDIERRAEARNNQRMDDKGERNLFPTSPPSGSSDENTAKNLTDAGIDVRALTKWQKYVHKTKAFDNEHQ